jgi:MFS family permease
VEREEALPSLHDAWDWRVIRMASSMAVIAFGYGGITSFVAILSGERGIEPKSLYFTVLALTVVVVRVLFARLGDVYGPTRLLYPSYAAMPLAFLLLSVADTRGELVLSAVFLGVGFGGAWPAFSSYVLTHTDPARRARTFGSIVWAFDLGIGIGSLAIGALGDYQSLGFAFGVAAAISCLAIPIFAVTSRGLARAS